MHLVVDDYCYALQLWWERLPWISKVVPMKKLQGGEEAKAREDWDMGSRAGSSSSKGKERWCVADAVGADSIRKVGGEEKHDGDGTSGTAEAFSAFGKKVEGKGNGEAGLSGGEDARLDQCKPIHVVSQAHLDWALKERGIFSGPRDCWEEGQSSRGLGRAFCDGHSSPLWVWPGGVDSRPSLGLKEGQPTAEATWAFSPFRSTKERPLKETRASFSQSRLERWFDEELLAGGMVSSAERSGKKGFHCGHVVVGGRCQVFHF